MLLDLGKKTDPITMRYAQVAGVKRKAPEPVEDGLAVIEPDCLPGDMDRDP